MPRYSRQHPFVRLWPFSCSEINRWSLSNASSNLSTMDLKRFQRSFHPRKVLPPTHRRGSSSSCPTVLLHSHLPLTPRYETSQSLCLRMLRMGMLSPSTRLVLDIWPDSSNSLWHHLFLMPCDSSIDGTSHLDHRAHEHV